MFDRKVYGLAFLAMVPWLAGCGALAGPVAEPPESGAAAVDFDPGTYEALSGEAGTVFWIDDDASRVRIFLWRGGPLAKKGHNHVLEAKNLEGAAFLPEDMLSGTARFDIVFPVRDIAVDPLPLRAEIGGAFAGTGMTEDGAKGTRSHMLGEKALNADRFPKIGLRSTRFYGEPPKLVLETEIVLHGIRRRRRIPATLRVESNRLRATGAFAIAQTEFGMTPFSAMGGALRLLDPILVEFEIVARSR